MTRYIDLRSSRCRSFKDLRTATLKVASYRRAITTFPPWTRVTRPRKRRRYYFVHVIGSHLQPPHLTSLTFDFVLCIIMIIAFVLRLHISFVIIIIVNVILFALTNENTFFICDSRHVQYQRDPRSYNHSHRMVLWGLSLGESLSCLFCPIDNDIRTN